MYRLALPIAAAAALVASSPGARGPGARSATSPSLVPVQSPTIRFVPANVRIATDTFEVALSQGTQQMKIGTQVVDVRKEQDRYVFTERISAVAVGIEGVLSFTFGAAKLNPLERTDKGTMQGTAFQGNIAVKNGRLTGMLQSPSANLKAIAVDIEAPDSLWLEEDMLFALLPTAELVEGQKATYLLLNDESGKAVTLNLTVEGKETIDVPAGRFETFRVKAQGPETTTFYVSTTAPRRVVRVNSAAAPIELRLVK